jgi:phage baseplate assembly protein W
MSYDRQIDQICPHIVAEEALFVSPVDRQTVVPLKPIASLNSVVIRYNSSFYLPSGGAMLAASTLGTTVGPFNVITGVNDTIIVSVNQGPDQTIVVPAQKQVTADKLRGLLNFSVKGMAFTSNGMQVGLQSGGLGPAASVYVDSASTLAATLGITSGREYRGRQIAPGWTLVVNPATVNSGRPSRLIVFDEPLKGFNDYVEITYNTIQQDCRRCGGLGVENDWRYGFSGEVAKVTDEQLLRQEVQKIMYTRQGTNPFNAWYGTNLIEAIGKKIANGQVLQNMITSEVATAFSRWQSIKQQQEQVIGQILTDEEYPYRLLSCTVTASQEDPTVIFINMIIQNRSSKPIQLERGLILPQPLDLLGSTQQQGLLQQSLSGYVLTG